MTGKFKEWIWGVGGTLGPERDEKLPGKQTAEKCSGCVDARYTFEESRVGITVVPRVACPVISLHM